MLSFTLIVFSALIMSNSNYSMGLERLKPVHTAYCRLHNLAENRSWARDVNGRDRDETETRLRRDRDVCLPRPRRDRDVDNFSQDETLVRLETASRPRRRDRDHNPVPSTHDLNPVDYQV